jgi:hypothetical protein
VQKNAKEGSKKTFAAVGTKVRLGPFATGRNINFYRQHRQHRQHGLLLTMLTIN